MTVKLAQLLYGNYFVTGTDTEVGKTFVCHQLLKHHRQAGLSTLGLKPVASGFEQGMLSDAVLLKKQSTKDLPLEVINPFRFAPPIAPHIAAAQAGVTLSAEGIATAMLPLLNCGIDLCLVEGAGGWAVPLNESEKWQAVVARLLIPVIFVVGMRLGCINHAILTEQAMLASRVNVAGWIANQLSPDMLVYQQNLDTLKHELRTPYLGEVPWQGNV